MKALQASEPILGDVFSELIGNLNQLQELDTSTSTSRLEHRIWVCMNNLEKKIFLICPTLLSLYLVSEAAPSARL